MFKKIKYILIYSLLFVWGVSFSQNLMRNRAEKLYQKLEYLGALSCYQNMISRDLENEIDLRVAIKCCIKLNKYDKANEYSSVLFRKFSNQLLLADYINYINSLKYIESYKKADSLIKITETNFPTNKFIIAHQNQPNYLADLKIDSLNYFIKNINAVNTKFTEFSLTKNERNNFFYFSSNKRNATFRNEKFAMDDSYFIDTYECNKIDSIRFENIQPINRTVDSKYHDGPISFSQDGKTMFLTRNNYLNKTIGKSKSNIVNLKLYTLKFDSISNRWEEPISFKYNSDEYSIGHASINKEGTKLYFVSDMPGGFGKTDIYVSEWQENNWGKPINLGSSINTPEREMFPVIHEDGTLFFSSDGKVGLGGLDIYFSPIQYDLNFEAQNLGYPLNSSHDDFSLLLNKDLLTGYFSSNRTGGHGEDDLYFFKSKTSIIPKLLTGIVKDITNGQIIPNTKVYLYDKTFMRLDSFTVDSSGRYLFSVKSEHEYELKTNENMIYLNYKKDSLLLQYSENIIDVLIQPKYKLAINLIDSKSRAPLDNVNVTIKNSETSEIINAKTNDNGFIKINIGDKKNGDKLSFQLKLEKDGYISIVDEINLVLDSTTIIELENPMEFKMEKIAKGVDLAKVINLKPIYFDLAKWNIRTDAAVELDRIITLMNENPTIKIELGSHTDCRSDDSYNLTLSSKRALSALNYLVSKGISKNRLISKGYGETKSISPCACEGAKLPLCTEDQHQLNRRTEFIIVSY